MVDEAGMTRLAGGKERRRARELLVEVEFWRRRFGVRPSRRAAGRDMVVRV